MESLSVEIFVFWNILCGAFVAIYSTFYRLSSSRAIFQMNILHRGKLLLSDVSIHQPGEMCLHPNIFS